MGINAFGDTTVLLAHELQFVFRAASIGDTANHIGLTSPGARHQNVALQGVLLKNNRRTGKMPKRQSDSSCRPPSVGDASTSQPAQPWIDESWHITMGKRSEDQRKEDSGTSDPRDLCCICTYQAECMYRGTVQHPKQYCELFDVDVTAIVPHQENGDRHREETSEVFTGLCFDCENRKDCTIRSSKGNVWHCEEYR